MSLIGFYPLVGAFGKCGDIGVLRHKTVALGLTEFTTEFKLEKAKKQQGRTMKHKALQVTFFAAVIVAACKKPQGPTSEVSHKAGDLVYNLPWQWAKVPAAFLTKKRGSIVDTRNPLYQRISKATQKVWEAAKSIDPRIERANVPKPLAILMDSPDVDAWVEATSICVVNGPHSDETTAKLAPDSFRFYIPQEHCYESAVSFSAKSFVEWFNAKGKPCQIRLEAQGFGFGTHCNGAFDKASAIAVPAPEPALRFTTQLAKSISDDELIYVAAHELGHYLRSHFVNVYEHYNYFFKDDAGARKAKPTPYAPFVEKGREIFELLKSAQQNSYSTVEIPARAQELIKEAAALGLGVYTSEQEADEVAIEIMHKLGVNPRAAVDFQLNELKLPTRDWNYPYEKCTELIKNNWLENGKKAPIALDGIDDPHHNPCYRAWNMEQEIAAHGW